METSAKAGLIQIGLVPQQNRGGTVHLKFSIIFLRVVGVSWTAFLLMLLILASLAAPINCDADDEACAYFFGRLTEIPHKKLALSENGFESIWDGNRIAGCEVVFETHETLVSGEKVFDVFQSLINAPGWVIDDHLTADGPGSSSVGIENAHRKCSIHWSQHSWIDEKTGNIEQSSDIEVIVQCASKSKTHP